MSSGEQAIRFDEMFEKLILPPRAKRSCRVTFVEETSTYRRHEDAFDNVDVIVLEGIGIAKL